MNEDPPRWYVVRTPPKREHIVASHLRELEGVEVFCPRLRYRKATRRGKVWWVEAMFPGYVLAKFSLAEMQRMVAYQQGVRGLVKFGNDIPPVPDILVETLRREMVKTADEETLPETITLRPRISCGDEVEVAHGPLGGFLGTVVDVLPGRERVRVLLEFLGQTQVVELDLFSLLLPRRPLP